MKPVSVHLSPSEPRVCMQTHTRARSTEGNGAQAHSARINDICFGLDGDRMLTGADDGSLRIWIITADLSDPSLPVRLTASSRPKLA